MRRTLALSESCRGDLYSGLARGLGAGISPEQTLNAVVNICGGRLAAPLRRARDAVRKGVALTPALDQQGLLPRLDRALVGVAEDAGRLESVFDHLARRCERSHARWRKLKGRLWLPGFVGVIALFALPVPALFAGRISATDYLLHAGLMLALIAVCVHAARRAAGHFRSHGAPSALTRAARTLPLLARLSRLHERASVAEMLALVLASGISAHDALGHLARAVANSVHRTHLGRAKSGLDAGLPLADALRGAELLDAREGYAIVSAGEQAGQLERVLERYAALSHQMLDDVYDLLAQWVPVAAYFAVAGAVAAGLLG